MNKSNCNIIKDILPLYIDEVVSKDTKTFVEEHLATCENCKAEAEKMAEDISVPISKEIISAEKNAIKKVKKKILNKKIIIATISVVVAIAIIVGAFFASVLIYIPIEYDSSKMSVTTNDKYIYLNYTDSYVISYGCEINDDVIDGEEKDILIIECKTNFWTNYIEPIFPKDDLSTEQSYFNQIQIAELNEYDIIYYGNYNEAVDEDINSPLEEYDVIWEK